MDQFFTFDAPVVPDMGDGSLASVDVEEISLVDEDRPYHFSAGCTIAVRILLPV